MHGCRGVCVQAVLTKGFDDMLLVGNFAGRPSMIHNYMIPATYIHSHHTLQACYCSSSSNNMQLYIHAYMHTCIHAYMHTSIHAYILTCMHAYTHKCIHAYNHTCIHAWSHTCIHAPINSYKRISKTKGQCRHGGGSTRQRSWIFLKVKYVFPIKCIPIF